jgi:hypothetical protein
MPAQLLRILGTCGVGNVWAGVDAAGTELSIAVLDSAVAADPRWREAFKAQADALARAGTIRPVSADFTAQQPWAACAAGSGPGAEQIFIALGQEYQPTGDTPVPPAPPAPTRTNPVPVPATAGGHPARWIGIVAILLLLPGAGSGIIAATIRPTVPKTAPTVSAKPSASVSASPTPFTTPTPARPGLEPPESGRWPASWPTFAAADKTDPANLPGLGFLIRLPSTWQCTPQQRTPGFARYSCGDGAVQAELLARTCPKPCDPGRRAELRGAEEAWGLRWTQAGTLTDYAETSQLDEAARYALIVVAFWHSTPRAALDREVVFRATAPPDRTDEVRKVANAIRQAVG